jgi:hypothetical protein
VDLDTGTIQEAVTTQRPQLECTSLGISSQLTNIEIRILKRNLEK